jgi:putative Mn2+ efflux pump MntP
MLWEAYRGEEEDKADISKMWLVLTLSVATSIDALAVGLSFAFLEVDIWLASLTIGIVAFLVTLLAFAIGRRVGHLLGRYAEALGGLILIGIGIKVLVEHLG